MSKYDKASLVHIPSGYKSGTLYNVLPNDADGDFDFTRASTATRVDENGLIETIAIGTPRLNYPLLDGVVQDNPVLLLEPQRTNLITYSEDTTTWGKNQTPVVTLNNGIAPDGTQSSDKAVVNSISEGFYNFSAGTVTSGTTYTTSIFIKHISGVQTIRFGFAGTGFGGDNDNVFNIVNGTIVSSVANSTNQIINYGNGWFRLICTKAASATNTGGFLLYGNVNAEIQYNVWGAQIEVGSYPTSYIPSLTGSQTTRSADAANGAGTADDFNDSEGVLYANIAALADEGIRQISINDNSSSDRVSIILGASSNQVIASTHVSGSDTNLYLNTTNNTTLYNKYAYKYKTNDFSFWINGFEQSATIVGGATFPDGTLANMDYDRGDGVYNFYGKTKEVIVFREALSDTELEALTSYDSFNSMATEQLYTIE